MIAQVRFGTLILSAAIICLLSICCRAGEIRGIAQPAANAREARLYVYSKDGETEYYDDAKIGKDGKFHFRELPSGKYQLSLHGQRVVDKWINDVLVGEGLIDLGTITLDRSSWIVGTVLPSGSSTRITATGAVSASASADDEGRFAIDGLVGGKYKVVYLRDGYMSHSVDIELELGKMGKLPPVSLVACGRIAGKVVGSSTNRPLPHWSVTARSHDTNRTYSSSTIDSKTGRYTIQNLPPGRYDLTIGGPAFVIIGNSSLLGSKTPQAEASEAIHECIDKAATALRERDTDGLHRLLAEKCIFLGRSEWSGIVKEIHKNESFYPFVGVRESVLIRCRGDHAVSYTRAVFDPPASERQRVFLAESALLDCVERWELLHNKEGWRISGYAQERDLSYMLSCLRSTLERSLPSAAAGQVRIGTSLAMTDDPKLTGVSIQSGRTSEGHDWVVQIPPGLTSGK